MRKILYMLIGVLMISSWVTAEHYLELKLQRAETWLYFAGILLFFMSAGFCLLMKDVKKAMILSLVCAAVMCVLSLGLIWTVLPVVLMFWEYRFASDNLDGKDTSIWSMVFTALSAVYSAAAVAWIIAARSDGKAPRRFGSVTDVYVAVILLAAFVFLAVVCDGRKKREASKLEMIRKTSKKQNAGKNVAVSDPIGFKGMYIQCVALFAIDIWMCFTPDALSQRYRLRMTLLPWLVFVYLTQCRDRGLTEFLDKIKSRFAVFGGSDADSLLANKNKTAG